MTVVQDVTPAAATFVMNAAYALLMPGKASVLFVGPDDPEVGTAQHRLDISSNSASHSSSSSYLPAAHLALLTHDFPVQSEQQPAIGMWRMNNAITSFYLTEQT